MNICNKCGIELKNDDLINGCPKCGSKLFKFINNDSNSTNNNNNNNSNTNKKHLKNKKSKNHLQSELPNDSIESIRIEDNGVYLLNLDLLLAGENNVCADNEGNYAIDINALLKNSMKNKQKK